MHVCMHVAQAAREHSAAGSRKIPRATPCSAVTHKTISYDIRSGAELLALRAGVGSERFVFLPLPSRLLFRNHFGSVEIFAPCVVPHVHASCPSPDISERSGRV